MSDISVWVTDEKYKWYRNKRTGRVYQEIPESTPSSHHEQDEGTFVKGVLPEVQVGRARKLYDGTEARELTAGPWSFELLYDAVPTEEEMLGYIAAYRYVQEHPEVVPEPPLDEEQVQAVATALWQAHYVDSNGSPDYRETARRLVQRGVRVEGS